MPKRTTIILDDDIYEELVKESARKYGTTKAISKVVNELLRKALTPADELIRLLYSKKYAMISEEEFEKFRKELSRGFEER